MERSYNFNLKKRGTLKLKCSFITKSLLLIQISGILLIIYLLRTLRTHYWRYGHTFALDVFSLSVACDVKIFYALAVTDIYNLFLLNRNLWPIEDCEFFVNDGMHSINMNMLLSFSNA